MFRIATVSDIPAIAKLYDTIHTEEENGRTSTGWQRGVYPTQSTAEKSVALGEMFVYDDDGIILAAAKINRTQEKEYKTVNWSSSAPDSEVMVIHTLVVSPEHKGKGIGTAFVKFYEDHASKHGCRYLRMDTNEKNSAARALYKKLGYTEAGIVPTVFNGIPGVNLVCLEKTL